MPDSSLTAVGFVPWIGARYMAQTEAGSDPGLM